LYTSSLGRNLLSGAGKSGAGLRARAKVGGRNERLWEHRIGHLRFQACGDCDWRDWIVLAIGFIPGGFRICDACWRNGRKTDLENRGRINSCENSIVDLMKLLKLDSSLGARKQLAQELGYTGALDGSATMNVWLQKQVMTKLAESGGKVPDSLKA
jgi:hypothetical protein